jgi:hypothetical protein
MNHLRSFTLAIAVAALGLVGCGGGNGAGSPPRLVTSQIQSDSSFDGDIEQTSPIAFTITQGMSSNVQSVFAGIDPVTRTEFRAFLVFPFAGAGGVPGDARIDSAFLDLHINNLQPTTGSFPLLIELIEIQPPTLIATDYDRAIQPPLASLLVSPPISQAEVGTNVSIDVTPLMLEAQRLGLVDFQVRILEDLGSNIPILIEVNDTTGADRGSLGPLLTVTYF